VHLKSHLWARHVARNSLTFFVACSCCCCCFCCCFYCCCSCCCCCFCHWGCRFNYRFNCSFAYYPLCRELSSIALFSLSVQFNKFRFIGRCLLSFSICAPSLLLLLLLFAGVSTTPCLSLYACVFVCVRSFTPFTSNSNLVR